MARLRTHHRRKRARARRQDAELRRLMSGLDVFIAKVATNLAQAFAYAFKRMADAMQDFARTCLKSMPLSNAVQLDAEPFWEEWPDIIDG